MDMCKNGNSWKIFDVDCKPNGKNEHNKLIGFINPSTGKRNASVEECSIRI